ncbi:putative sensor histidine kinase pdtaS [Paenibacillus konkukensis]|uniref:histidine kinase n=1 Tax=Paenibacillus konkukensis TaxID=2020716 RepID=A0ABY4RIC3_9BACL|nr:MULTISPECIES: histidine kinase N-terminal domain-containing protein [Paenibacillus]UQZ82209.1 putative sensor histidine kinase pdtaS [Paenibacillus konkukensis]
MTLSIAAMCAERTLLSADEAAVIEDLAGHLQLIADVSQADVFIDCPLPDPGTALVVAQAHPATAPSLYKTSVVGQYAYAHNEPAVMFCLLSGQQVLGSRGMSQEHIAMQQHVVPIRAKSGKVLGALIMEQDISERLEQEKHVEQLMETTEQLTETLLNMAMSDGSMPLLMHEGIVLFDERERVTYTNPRALAMLQGLGRSEAAAVKRCTLQELFHGKLEGSRIIGHGGIYHEEVQIASKAFELKAVSIYKEQRAVGGLMLIRDVSDLKEKDKQLMIKSAVIKEIHHRVKNNLQTVSSLLRLQMRRTRLDEVKTVYRDSINRINSIAIIHEMLAFDGLDTIRFIDVVDRIAKNIVSSSAKPDQSIRVKLYGDELPLASDTATTLALVVNELVQNCVVHAFADRDSGEIEIELQAAGRIATVRVSDNGAGMIPAERRSGGRGHLGLKITETLVTENLGGVMRMASGDRGTDVQLTFPLSKT